MKKAFNLLVPVVLALMPPLFANAQVQQSIPLKVPAGMKPVVKQQADGSWIIEVVSEVEADEDAVAPATSADDAEKAETDTTGAKAKSTDEKLEAEWKKLDWESPVPSSPAFVALGISPEDVSSPSTPREFALSLLNGTDRQGRIQTGFAMDFAPATWFGPGLSHDVYASNWLYRALYNTSVSVGTTKASEDGDAQRVAVGVSMRLWNSEEDDVNRVLSKFAEDFVRRNPLPINNPLTSADDAAYKSALASRHNLAEAGLVDLYARLRTQTWGRGSASIAWAPTWISESGKWNDLRYDGSVAWAAASFQLNGPDDDELKSLADGGAAVDAKKRFWHLLTQAQFREGESVDGEGDDKTTYHQDSLLIAARLRYGTVDLNGSAELGYLRIWDGPQGDGNALRYGISLEKRMSDNTWLVISAGHEMGLSSGIEDESFVAGGVRFGLGQKPSVNSNKAMNDAASVTRN